MKNVTEDKAVVSMTNDLLLTSFNCFCGVKNIQSAALILFKCFGEMLNDDIDRAFFRLKLKILK